MGAFGLQTHIWNNNLKSIALLAGFPILLLILLYGITVMFVGLTGDFANAAEGFALAATEMRRIWPFAFLAAGVWFSHRLVRARSNDKLGGGRERPFS